MIPDFLGVPLCPSWLRTFIFFPGGAVYKSLNPVLQVNHVEIN